MMASMADRDTNRCWPSYQRLADDCMTTRRTIIRTIKQLEELGYLKIQKRYSEEDKKHSSNMFQLSLGVVTSCHHGSDTVTPGGSDTVTPNTVTLFKQSLKHGVVSDENLNQWIQHRKEKRQSLTPTTVQQQAKDLNEWHDEGIDCNEIVLTSIRNGWTGLFKPEKATPKKKVPTDMAGIRQLIKQHNITLPANSGITEARWAIAKELGMSV